MNQDNNFNQNDFNYQGNNGISNNQPLNNQSFNQGMEVNQQPINPHPQSVSNFQQSINQMNMQQPTTQFMDNIFENVDNNNQSFNNKPPKKMNLGLIIGGIVTVIVIVTGLIIVPTLFNSNSSKLNNESNVIDNIKNGTVELTMTSSNTIKRYDEGIIYYENYDYFETKNSENQFVVVDSNGKQVLPITEKKLNGEYKYLGDGYFIYNTKNEEGQTVAVLVKNGKLIVSFDSYSSVSISRCAYKNGIIYIGISSENSTIAYDIKNKKELWKVNGTFVDGYVLDDEFIRVQTENNPSGDNSSFLIDPIPNTIVDYNGNKIISGGDIKPVETLGREKYDTQIYTSKSNAYLEIKNNEYIKVYDLNNKLKSTINIKETDTKEYYFRKMLYSGVFIVEECQKSPYDCKEILYNEDGKELIKVDSITVESYVSHVLDEYLFPKDMDLISTTNRENEELISSCILIKNGELLAKYKNCKHAKHNYGLEHNYLFYYVSDNENSLTYGGDTYKIVNLDTMKEINAPIEYTSKTDISNQSPMGAYVILTTGNEYYVYDNEMNKKYESQYWVRPVNEKYVISTNKYEREENDAIETNLINIETGKVTKLVVKGEYYDNNAKGLVTYDGTNYYLYSFK